MSAIEQYLIDTYRASQHGAPMPPPTGRDDVAALRAVRSHARAEAVLEGHPATHPWRAALLRLLRHPGGPGGACATPRS